MITGFDKNVNTDSIKTETLDNMKLNERNNQTETNIRESFRLSSTKPIIWYGIPITFRLLQVTPLTNGIENPETDQQSEEERQKEKKL